MPTIVIKKFDKRACNAVRADINAALKTVATKHGIKLVAGRGTFDDTHFTLKLEMGVLDESGADLSAKRDFEMCATHFGLKPEDFGCEFVFDGETYRLDGVRQRAERMPLLATLLRAGQRYRLPAGAVREALSRARGTPHRGSAQPVI